MDENLVNVTDEGVDINVGGVSNFARFTDKNLGDNFNYLKNPTTGKIIGVGNDFFEQYGQDLADNGFNPVSGADAFKPDVVDNESDNIVTSTQDDRDDVTLTSQDADNAIGDAEAGTESPNSVLERLNAERERINTTTQTELDSIEQAGEDAGAAYQSIVDEQEENRKQTMASEVVRAGEKGGFLSTQQAGTAALLATDGKKGEAFVGTGGALDRTRQTLDRAVALAKAKQKEAIANAKYARGQAIKTGKKEDYQMAVDLAKLAQEFKNDADDLNIKKQQLALSISAEDRAWNADERAWRADERAGEKFTYDMWKDERAFETGQDRFDRTQAVQEAWLDRSITEDDKKQAQENILSMANSGIPLDQITPEELTELEIRAGYAEGSLEAIYSRAYNQARLGDVMDMAKLEKAQNDVRKSIKSLSENKNVRTQNNNAETPSGSVMAGNIEIPDTGNDFNDTVSYLQALKSQDMLDPFAYREQINALMDIGRYEDNERADVESMVDQAMDALSPIVQPENEGSDYGIEGTDVNSNTLDLETGNGDVGIGDRKKKTDTGYFGIRDIGEKPGNVGVGII